MTDIIIPESVNLEGITDERGNTIVADFVNFFMIKTVASDDSWGKNVSLLFEAMELRDLFKDAKPGDTVIVPDVLWKKALKVIKTPTHPYAPRVMLSLRTFFEACGITSTSAE